MNIKTHHQKITTKQINKLLSSIDDPINQFSQYLTWIVRGKYLTELRICWDLQGFDDDVSWMKLINISLSLTKQEYNETQRQIDEYRRSKDYGKDMAEFELNERGLKL